VSYTRDDLGRETKVSSTYNSQPFDYIYSAAYEGPQGALTQFEYGIRYTGGTRVKTLYTYSPQSLQLTHLETYGLSLNYSYTDPEYATSLIHDITDVLNPSQSKHYQYDRLDRLAGYWVSSERNGTYSYKQELSYDRYGNITNIVERMPGNCNWPVGCSYAFTVDASTNRLLSRQTFGGSATYSYDAAGNMTSKGTFDAENRLTSSGGVSYLYDGNGRRFRKSGVNYIYSYMGQLLMEDRIPESASNNYIYFNGQVVAIHQQDDNFRVLFKDHLGSTRSVVKVNLPGTNWEYNWTLIEGSDYGPFGETISPFTIDTPTRYMYQGKERENNLDYFGARYYEGALIRDGSPMR